MVEKIVIKDKRTPREAEKRLPSIPYGTIFYGTISNMHKFTSEAGLWFVTGHGAVKLDTPTADIYPYEVAGVASMVHDFEPVKATLIIESL